MRVLILFCWRQAQKQFVIAVMRRPRRSLHSERVKPFKMIDLTWDSRAFARQLEFEISAALCLVSAFHMCFVIDVGPV